MEADFANCCNELVAEFRMRKGHMTRFLFQQRCKRWHQDALMVQAYFEAAGMKVNRKGREVHCADVFRWDLG